MFRVLLAKDLRRAWRNPVPWLVNLALPLFITALIGLAFGGSNESDQLGRIKFALVDEDDSPATTYLRGYLVGDKSKAAHYLDPVFVNRETALRQINNNEISAVVIIPTNFTADYLTGRKNVALELIKNPSESIHPAVLEEMLGALVTGMNAVSRNFHSGFPEWSVLKKGADSGQLAELIERVRTRALMASNYITSPLIGYEKGGSPSESKASNASSRDSKAGGGFNLFAFLLIGMTGMFLMFLAGAGMMDLHRELRIGAFERYCTLRQQPVTFLFSKVIFAGALVLFGSMVILGGGGLIFRIPWNQPLALAMLTFSYACFAAGLMALLGALAPDERQANSFNYIVSMSLAIMGGCMFPARQLPEFMRHYVTPFLPTEWFTDTARDLAYGNIKSTWIFVSLKLVILSAVLIAVAGRLLRRRYETGRGA